MMTIIIILGVICFIVTTFIKYYIKGSLTQLDQIKLSINGKLPKKYEKLSTIMLLTHLIMWLCIILVIINFLIKVLG